MTGKEKEAVEMLKAIEKYFSVGSQRLSGEASEAVRMGISALEKQIPKKPIGDLNSVPHYRCPVCKNAVVLYEYSAKLPHCQWCGQKLDWGDGKYIETKEEE